MPDHNDTRNIDVVKKNFDELFQKQGFQIHQYEASRRYVRKSASVTHEVSVRLMAANVFQVELSKIQTTSKGRRVNSKAAKGCLATCLKFVQQEYPSDAYPIVSCTKAT